MEISSRVKLKSGELMPIIGLGTWNLKGDDAFDSVSKAFDEGYRMIDTSGDYNNQPQVGEAIRNYPLPREDVFLVTKVEEDENAREAAQAKLDELGLDYADLILLHRPPTEGSGTDLWAGLIEARDDGLTHSIGVSNYSIEQIAEIADDSGELPAVNQIEWSPFGYSLDMLEFCDKNSIVVQAYSPLTHGKRLENETITDIAKDHGKSPAQVMLRWCLQSGVVPIAKASKPGHIKDNIEIFNFELSEGEMNRLYQLNESYSSIGPNLAYV